MDKQSLENIFLILLQSKGLQFKQRLLESLIFEDNISNIEIINRLLVIPGTKKEVQSCFFPKTLEDMGSIRMCCNDKKSLIETAKIVFYLFNKFSSEINSYLVYKKRYERLLFTEQYFEASKVLKQIKNKLGFSLWLCGQELIIKEKIKGLEENKKLLAKYTRVFNQSPLINTLLEFYSYSAEDNLSYLNYQDKVKKYLLSLKDKDVINYLEYKLNLEYKPKKYAYNKILHVESQISMIDLYNSMINIIQFISFEENGGRALDIIRHFPDTINDQRISNINIIEMTKNNYSIREKSFLESKLIKKINIEVYKAIEEYSIGKYEESIQRTEKYLKHNSDDFIMICLLIKSIINNSGRIKSKNKLYNIIYKIYMLDSDFNQAVTNMYNYLKLYRETSWYYKMRGFLGRKLALYSEEYDKYFSYINDVMLTPNFVKYICGDQNKIDFLNIFTKYCPQTIELYKYTNNLSDKLELDAEFSPIRKNIYIATREINKGNNIGAIKYLLDIRNTIGKDDFYNIERISRKLFLAYNNNNSIFEIVNMIVDNYFINKNLINRVSIRSIVDKIKYTRDLEIKKSIKYPIFIYLNDSNDYKQQRIAYANYMDCNNFKTIAEVIENNKSTQKYLLIFFLYKVCTLHLIKRYPKLAKTSAEAEDVRVDILRELINIDVNNKKIYYDEISIITRNKSIRERIKSINQSRIFVDVDLIKLEIKDILKENFDNYIRIKDFKDEVVSFDIMDGNYVNTLNTILTEMNQRMEKNVNYKQEVLVLRDIISRIVEEFLFNPKYGLNTFLSSRIRHGYCKNKLMALFDEYNLLSKKQAEDSEVFLVNDYWDSREDVKNSGYYKEFKNCLSDFTYSIDKKAIEIKEKWIRIKLSKEQVGLFDYSETTNYLRLISYDDINDFELFFEQVIQILWGHTDSLLALIREKIQGELKDYFMQALGALETNLRELDDEFIVEVIRNINLCKSRIPNMIKEFSDIFYRKDIQYKDFSMNDLVETCREINQKLNSKFRRVNLKSKIGIKDIFSGRLFSYFVDILNILINNALEHSGFSELSQLNINVEISNWEAKDAIDLLRKEYKDIEVNNTKFMFLNVTNNLSTEVDISMIEERIGNIFASLDNYEMIRKFNQTEGGSGLYKIYKIIDYNIVQYNIEVPYTTIYAVNKEKFSIGLLMGIDNLIV